MYDTDTLCTQEVTDYGTSCSSESVTITPQDARWVGAWWMGFLVSSALLLVSSVPFWFLPRTLPMQEGDESKPTAAHKTLEGTGAALNNHHDLKFTEIAKGTTEKKLHQ